jgi:hypothetical protein
MISRCANSLQGTCWILVTFCLCFHPQQPAQMHQSSHSPINHRPPSMAAHHSLSTYAHSSGHYGSVKVEDENYAVRLSPLHADLAYQFFCILQPANHHSSHSGHYSLPPFSHTSQQHEIDSWHTYSSERAQLHR